MFQDFKIIATKRKTGKSWTDNSGYIILTKTQVSITYYEY